jgi:hypothetical protein
MFEAMPLHDVRSRRALCDVARASRPCSVVAAFASCGGSSGIALDADGNQLLVKWNGSSGVSDERKRNFGLCAVTILDIPADEVR